MSREQVDAGAWLGANHLRERSDATWSRARGGRRCRSCQSTARRTGLASRHGAVASRQGFVSGEKGACAWPQDRSRGGYMPTCKSCICDVMCCVGVGVQ
jgi:hypothetical protein